MSAPTVFLSYASEDFEFVERLAHALGTLNVSVWHAPGQLQPGDSIVEKIDTAMKSARFALLIISPSFLAKAWPKKEFHALTALALNDPGRRLIPVLHHLTDQDYLRQVPMMADIKWISSERGLDWIVCSVRVALAEPHERALPRQCAVVEQHQTVSSFPDLQEALKVADDGATVFLYPGTYEAPAMITKRVVIAARGLARDTVVQIPKGSTLRIMAPELEVDGVAFVCAPPRASGPTGDEFKILETMSHHPYVRRGDALLAIMRHQQFGRILFKNCVIDGNNQVDMLIATDARIELRNCRLAQARYGLAVRNGGYAALVACTMESAGAGINNRASLSLIACKVSAGEFSSDEGCTIEIKRTQMVDSYVHAYSGGKVFVAEHSKFLAGKSERSVDINYLYATQYSQITVEDTELEGGNCALYAYGGSLLSARRVTVRGTKGFGIRFSEGCSGDIEDCIVRDCQGEAVRVQKGANPRLLRSIFESNAGGGVVSVMNGQLNISDCHVQRNGRGGIISEGGAVNIQKTRVFLNDGPGIQVAAECVLELIDSEVGQNANGQLLVGGKTWYSSRTFFERLKELLSRRRPVRVIRTAIYQ